MKKRKEEEKMDEEFRLQSLRVRNDRIVHEIRVRHQQEAEREKLKAVIRDSRKPWFTIVGIPNRREHRNFKFFIVRGLWQTIKTAGSWIIQNPDGAFWVHHGLPNPLDLVTEEKTMTVEEMLVKQYRRYLHKKYLKYC